MINYSNNKEFVMVIECKMLWKGSLVIKKRIKSLITLSAILNILWNL